MGSFVVFEVENIKIKTLVNQLIQINVGIFNLKEYKKAVRFKILSKFESVVIAKLNELCYTYKTLKKSGFSNFYKSNCLRFGFLIGFIVVSASVFLLANTVTNFNLNQLALQKAPEINQILQSHNIKKGTLSFKLNVKELERAFMQIAGVSFAGVNLKGNTLFINCQSELENPEIMDMAKHIEKVSTVDAIITRVIVNSGTAVVKIGDTVRIGQSLISPCEGLEDNQTPIRAVGQIYGRVFLQEEICFLPNTIEMERTGKSKSVTNIDFFSFKTKGELVSPFESYEKVKTIKVSNSILPFKIIKTTFYETAFVNRQLTLDQSMGDILKLANSKLDKRLGGGVLIKRWHTVKKYDNMDIITVTYEAEMQIDRYLE